MDEPQHTGAEDENRSARRYGVRAETHGAAAAGLSSNRRHSPARVVLDGFFMS